MLPIGSPKFYEEIAQKLITFAQKEDSPNSAVRALSTLEKMSRFQQIQALQSEREDLRRQPIIVQLVQYDSVEGDGANQRRVAESAETGAKTVPKVGGTGKRVVLKKVNRKS